MFGSGALSNHSCGSDYELWDMSGGYDMMCDFTNGDFKSNPLYYHIDITKIVEVLSKDDKYTKVKTLRGILLYLSIPNKVIEYEGDKMFCHEKTFSSIVKGKVDWLVKNEKKMVYIKSGE